MKSGSDLHSGRLSRCEADAALDTLPWRQRARLSGVAGRVGMAACRRAAMAELRAERIRNQHDADSPGFLLHGFCLTAAPVRGTGELGFSCCSIARRRSPLEVRSRRPRRGSSTAAAARSQSSARRHSEAAPRSSARGTTPRAGTATRRVASTRCSRSAGA
eukprot:scaffold81887_cov45-Phaeocystis_antarctica.AAC.1